MQEICAVAPTVEEQQLCVHLFDFHLFFFLMGWTAYFISRAFYGMIVTLKRSSTWVLYWGEKWNMLHTSFTRCKIVVLAGFLLLLSSKTKSYGGFFNVWYIFECRGELIKLLLLVIRKIWYFFRAFLHRGFFHSKNVCQHAIKVLKGKLEKQ